MNSCSPEDDHGRDHGLVTAGDATMEKIGRQSPEQDDDNEMFTSNGAPQKSFPEVLKAILSDPDHKAAVSWLPHGKSFLVLDRKKFVQYVLPKYLGKATKYTSFTRKLSRWNFARVPSGPDEGAWFNKSFFRDDDVKKIREMKCAKRKRVQIKEPLPSSRPLKKRPVDASLFVPRVMKSAKSLKPEIEQHSILGGHNAYTFGGRPLALTDTKSVIQAAMQALLQSQQQSMGVPSVVRNPSPLLNPHLAAMNLKAFTALQAAQQRRSDS